MSSTKGTPKKRKTKKKTDASTGGAQARQVVPMLPLRDIVIYPHMVVPFFVGREKSINALEAAMADKIDIILCTQRDSQNNQPGLEDVYPVGCLSTVVQLVKLPDGTLKVLVEGKKRAQITQLSDDKDYVLVEVEELPENIESPTEAEALLRSLNKTFESYVKLNKRIPAELLMSIQSMDEPSRLADTIASNLNIKPEDKQALLELVDPVERMERLLTILQSEIEILQVERRIRSRVRKQMEKGQKEYYLNEQMAAIQKELGERDEFKTEIEELEKQIKASGMSPEARDKADTELRKLKMMAPMSAEATVIRNYIDWLLILPWKNTSQDNLDLVHAKDILDQDHYGLEKIKERIIEYLAVQSLSEKLKAPILCLVGPPGVGKSSLAKSIASAVERQFIRISLGGVRDEAEIRGHRKTYVGAMPGKLIQSMKKAGTRNPVFLLDEIDKMGSDYRGDPSSAMLEVLDPGQNATFNDHYLEVDFDLSGVMFIATANNLDTIPQPLLDRMELIFVSSYLETEKLQIAKHHLVPKQIEAHGLNEKKILIEDSALLELLRYYTREAGVRNIEREIANICRKAAKKWVELKDKSKPVSVKAENIEEYLGPRRHKFGQMETNDQIGMCNGLAWTEVGGDTLNIEVSVMPGKGNLKITGKLGDVMQESAHAAYSYVRSRATRWGLPPDFYEKVDIHIHVPEGAVPKDGPSAGITMVTALVSALTQKPVRRDIAMTGEITLRGNVLPIGGLKEKLLAAQRAGLTRVLIPEENVKDLYDVPEEILRDVAIVPVDHVDQVLRLALNIETDDPLASILGEARRPVTQVKTKNGFVSVHQTH